MLISGDAGIGKTRLLAEAAAQLHADGWPVLFGRADEERLVPYEPFVEALRQLADRAHLGLRPDEALPAVAAPLATLLPEFEPLLPDERPPVWDDPEAGRYRLFVAFATVLSRVVAEQRLALVLDDLQWADGPTLRLVRELIARTGSAGLLMLGAYRPSERDAPLLRLQDDLRRDRRVDELQLDGLGEADVAALAAALGAEATPAAVRELHEATHGNPFLVEQLLPALAAAADTSFAHEYAAMEVPEAIQILVLRRLQSLPADVVRTLSTAAILGREFRLTDLEAIAPPELLPVLPRLEDAVDAGLIGETDAEVDRFAFANDLLRRALLGQLGRARTAQLHLDAGRALERAGRDASEHAHHYIAAQEIGGAAGAATASIELARRHAAAHAHADAARQYRTALTALDELAPDAGAALRCEALVGLAASLEVRDIDEARTVYREAAEVADRAGLGEWLGEAAIGFSRWQQYAFVDVQAVELLERALAALPTTESGVRAQVLGLLGVRLDASAGQERREALWREGVEMARHVGDAPALTTILRYAPYVLWRPESLPERLAAADETVALATAAGLADQLLWGQVNAFAERLESGDVAAADQALDAARALAERARHRWFAWYLPTLLATRRLFEGDVDEGEWLARSALESRLAIEPGATEVFAAQLALCARLRGSVDPLVLPYLNAQVERFADRPLWRVLLADALITAGRHEEARPVLASVLAEDLPSNSDRLAVLALSVEAAARLGEIEAASARVDALSAFAGRFILVDRAWAVWGPTDRVLGVALAARGDATAAAEHFARAERQLAAAGAAWPGAGLMSDA